MTCGVSCGVHGMGHVIHYVAQYLHPGSCQAQHKFFHAMIDAESDASCQASQNNPRPAAPHQLTQPSVRGCNPSNDDATETVSWYLNLLCESLLEQLDEFPQDESDILTWKTHDAAGRSTSVHICVHRARSRSPRRQVGEAPMPQAAANPHAESPEDPPMMSSPPSAQAEPPVGESYPGWVQVNTGGNMERVFVQAGSGQQWLVHATP